ncbi:MAG: hypothetical protein RL095_4183 [Verrucomicrobiota bacterium]|jgi:serine/threonine-protein kinase HipA
MKRCLISLEEVEGDYSIAALKRLDPKLRELQELPYDQGEQLRWAAVQAGKISVQGMQPKFSARLAVQRGAFELVEKGGTYILKPQHLSFPELPENEAFTMLMARRAGLEVPPSGLVRCRDGSRSYFVQRFDRHGKSKLAVEDFGQLAGLAAEHKYQSSIEKVLSLVDRYCSFPLLARQELFRRLLFSFVFGNEDLHLKNLSLISRERRGVLLHELAPNYDLLNTTAVYLAAGRRFDDVEEMALPWQGRKRKMRRRDFVALAEAAGIRPQAQEGAFAWVREAAETAILDLSCAWFSPNLRLAYEQVLVVRLKALEMEG